MSFKKVGTTDGYGRRIFNDGVEQTADTSEFEVTLDDAGTTKWLQADLTTFSVAAHAFDGLYVPALGHILDGFAVPGGDAIGKTLTISGFHPDIRGDASLPRTRFFTESFLVQSSDVDDVQQNVDDEHVVTRTHISDEADANEGKLDSIITSLADGTYGLSALNTDLDNILSRLGITTDTGGSTTAGTAMAKLNAIMALATEIESEVIGPGESYEGAFGG